MINQSTSDNELHELHRRGVRGIRLDLYHENAMRDLEKQKEMLIWYAERIKPWNWSMAFLQLEPNHWEPLTELIATLPVQVVVDHHALLKARSMLPVEYEVQTQPGFETIKRPSLLGTSGSS